MNYSIDFVKKAAFVDELNNVLKIMPIEEIDQKILTIIEYLEERIDEIDKCYKK